MAILQRRFDEGDAASVAADLGAFRAAYGDKDALEVYRQLDEKNASTWGFVGSLAIDSPAAATEAIAGMKALKERPGLVKRFDDEVVPELDQMLGDAYGGIGHEARRSMEETVKGIYAQNLIAAGNDGQDGVDTKLLRQAVALASGGIVQHEGHRYPAPIRGLTQTRFDNWVYSIGPAQFAGVASGDPDYAYRQWRANGYLHNSALGEFMFYTLDAGTEFGPLLRSDGTPIRIRFNESLISPAQNVPDVETDYTQLRHR
jgi:hypothetical protein